MSEKLNSRIFAEHLRSTFLVLVPGTAAPVPLELFEVTEKDQSPKMEQFFLIFRGPIAPQFPQGIYTMEHEKLGKLDLFLVPVGPDEAGMCYQVVFNRFRQPS